ncbi:MAG: hypothetical protein JWQ21_988, partial [Herminiimonas sp.]|nr:hypothetical protein [Herminiimonas sp.]
NDLLDRHQRADWGVVDPPQIIRNRRALRRGQQILSAYLLGDKRERLWILTSPDRTTTTLLLPREFADMNRAHLIQWFHPALRIEFTASVAYGENVVPIFARQGQFDAACGPHAVAMAMSLLKEMDVSLLCERRAGVAARLWKATQETFFEGTSVGQLAEIVESLKTGRLVEPFQGNHRQCLAYAEAQLADGHLVVASWRSGRQHHWILIIGCEGLRVGSTFTSHALLALDPSTNEPLLAGYNARLEFAMPAATRRNSSARYLTLDGEEWQVKLTSALTIGARQ